MFDSNDFCQSCYMPKALVRVDKDGVCELCNNSPLLAVASRRNDFDKSFEQNILGDLFEKVKRSNRGTYDVAVMHSGGKDSSYVLWWLKNQGLRPVSFTVVDRAVNEVAQRNARTCSEKLGIDHFELFPDNNLIEEGMTSLFERFDEFIDIFAKASSAHPTDTLLSGCNTCLGCSFVAGYQWALKMNIPIFADGTDYEQMLPRTYGVENGWYLTGDEVKDVLLRKKAYRGDLLGHLWIPHAFDAARYAGKSFDFSALANITDREWPMWITPLSYLRISEDDIRAKLQELDLLSLEASDVIATNCTLLPMFEWALSQILHAPMEFYLPQDCEFFRLEAQKWNEAQRQEKRAFKIADISIKTLLADGCASGAVTAQNLTAAVDKFMEDFSMPGSYRQSLMELAPNYLEIPANLKKLHMREALSKTPKNITLIR